MWSTSFVVVARTEQESPRHLPHFVAQSCLVSRSYEPDEESVNNLSTTGSSVEDAGSQGHAAVSTSSHGASKASGNASGSGEGEPSPPVPWDPPTGTWSVRFPPFQTKRTFLHRTSIRELRRVLAGQGKAGGEGSENGTWSKTNFGNASTATLPVFLERRERLPEPAADDGKTGGKNAKKGGGKKPAGKKGDAPEQPPRPIESPWRCQAEIDLSPLVRVDMGGDRTCSEDGKDKGGVGTPATGGSPLRAELRAILALASPPAGAAPGTTDEAETNGEETSPQASNRNAPPAAEGFGVRRGRDRIGRMSSKPCREGR